ncbi:restriction endonuclease subunit S [Staphylococcus hominis]|nr:restriction endonuclease subunit S [Staphylococcus hominis]
MTEQTNTPELRFPEFKKEWKEYQFQTHLSKIETGTNKLGSEDFLGLPLLKMGNIQRGNFSFNKLEKLKKDEVVNKEHLIQNKDFLFNTRNTMELVGKSATWRGESNKFAFNSNIARLTLENMDTVFFNYLYNTPKLIHKVKSLAVGTTSVAAIYPRDLKKLKYFIPIFDEQLKIGEFFSKLDRQIELEEEKLELLEQQKRGYMQKIFSQTLRFKDEEDNVYPDWIRTKLINIVTPLKGQDDNITNLPILTISASRGWLNQKERFSQVIAGNSLKKYTQVKKNDLSYNKGNSKVAKYGIVFRLKNEALVPNVYKSFRPNENIDSIFIEKYFHNKTLDKQLRTRITSTARTDGLLNISDQDFYDIKLYIPILQEQTKIADFLNKLDKLIEKQSSKVELLKQRKQGLLQKMFV